MKFSFKNLKLQTKLLIYIIATSSVIFAFVIAIIAINFNSLIVSESEKAADSYSRQYANQMQAKLNGNYGIIKGLTFAVQSNSFQGADNRDFFAKALMYAVEKHADFIGCFASLEISEYGQNWDKSYGRFKYSAVRKGNSVILKFDSVNITGDVPNSGYAVSKAENKNYIKDPYFDTYTGNEQDRILMTSMGCVLKNKGKFAGLVEADIPLDWFQKVVTEIKPYENSYAFLLSNNGSVVAHPKKAFLGKSITDVSADYVRNFNLIEKSKKGEALSFTTVDSITRQTVYVTVTPVFIGDTDTPWSLAIVVPTNVIKEKAYENLWLLLIIGVFGLVLLSFTVWIIAQSISRPIVRTTKVLNQIAKGEILELEKAQIRSNDEIAQMGKSLNTLIDGLNNTANFANEIGKGNLKIQFQALSDNDVLGNALLNMQQNLLKVKEEEDQRKIEDEKRNWATHGLAKFGEILRNEHENMTELAFSVIQNLVQYLNANQGGLFILNDDDKNEKFLELLACYAYDRRKFLEKKILIGEGLVGSCFQEQETIYLTELPQNYITISSGLGESRPRALLIVPLKINDEIFGVIELASFKDFQPYEIEFVEKVGESIASTIKSVQINTRTAYLLQQSQEQSEEMRAQEEEMRQNMEELHAIQEEMSRKSAEMESLINALNASNYMVVYDLSGKIISVNDAYCRKLNRTREEMIGTHHSHNMEFSEETKVRYEQFWEDLQAGKQRKEITKIQISGIDNYFEETYTPITDNRGVPYKVLKIANDVTENKLMQQKINELSERLENREKELLERIDNLTEQIEHLQKNK